MKGTGSSGMGVIARWLRRLWRLLGSTKLAAVLIAALLLATLIASLFPQVPADPQLRELWLLDAAARYGRSARLVQALGLLDAFHGPWYVGLLLALLINTLACTVQRLPRLWRALTKSPTLVHPDAFYGGFAQRRAWAVPSVQAGLSAAEDRLGRAGYRYWSYVQYDEAPPQAANGSGTLGQGQPACGYLYAERGRWAQAGTVVSHLATFLLVLALLSRPTLSWQEPKLVLLPGQEYISSAGPQSPPQKAGRSAAPITVRSGALIVERYPGGQPRDYRVPLTVWLKPAAAITQTVGINHPLFFHGVAFHLLGYGPAAKIVAPEGSFQVAFAGGPSQEVRLAQAGLTIRLALRPEGGSVYAEVSDEHGTMLGSGMVTDGQQIQVDGTPLSFFLQQYTVWQVSHDPTFGLAVAAAGLLLLGTVLSLWIPHRRVWLRIDQHVAQMVGAGDVAGDFEMLAPSGELVSSVENAEGPAASGISGHGANG